LALSYSNLIIPDFQFLGSKASSTWTSAADPKRTSSEAVAASPLLPCRVPFLTGGVSGGLTALVIAFIKSKMTNL
jgi:hypothetical protein